MEFDSKKIYTVSEIIDEIVNSFRKKKEQPYQLTLDIGDTADTEVVLPNYANTLISKLRNIRHLKFAKDVEKHYVQKTSAVINMGDYTQQEQECILDAYLYRLMQRAKRTKNEIRRKQIVVIEEAHNYVPSVKNTLCKDIIVKLAREGRKYNISLCFITQRPRFFDQTAMSQSGNKIIFSLSNPDDIRHVAEDVVYDGLDVVSEIQRQRTGECLIVGDAFNSTMEVIIDFGE